jgi:hypothetical protein
MKMNSVGTTHKKIPTSTNRRNLKRFRQREQKRKHKCKQTL